MAKRLTLYFLLLNFCMPALYSFSLLYILEKNNISSKILLEYFKDNCLEEDLEDKEGEKDSKPFEKEIDKDFLLSYSSIAFSSLDQQQVIKYNSFLARKTNAFLEITTPPPKLA